MCDKVELFNFAYMIFKLENGSDVDLIQHTQSIIDQHPDTRLYVGCDSQNKRRGCTYAIVVAYRFTYGEGTRKGARYVYQQEWVDKTKDKFTRLWGEVERSVNLALWLEEKGFKVYQIDLDFNQDVKAGSHDMVASGVGYCRGFGFNVSIKPEMQCASRCGDHIVKKKGRRSRVWHKKRKEKV